MYRVSRKKLLLLCVSRARNCTLETPAAFEFARVQIAGTVAGGGLVKGGKKEEKGVSRTTRHSWEKGTRFDRYPEEAAGNNINISFI